MRNAPTKILFASIALLLTVPAVIAQEAPTTAPSAPEKHELIVPSQFSAARLAQQAAAQRKRDPIGFLAMDLADLTSLLDKFKTHEPTQPRQEQVVAKLDELIAMLEKQKKGAGSGGG